MRTIIALLFLATFSVSIQAQIKTPQPSPFQKLEQTVGLTEVTLEYSRPGVKGRSVFGDLVPYNEIWRTGANSRTKITFSTDVTIGDKALKKGTYAIFTKPSETYWNVYFYTDFAGNGTPQNWDTSKVALEMTAKVEQMPVNIETFTITLDDVTNNSAVIGFLWEKTYVGVRFETPTDKMVTAQIDAVMSGPSANDMYAAAVYYLQSDKDIQQAQIWIDKAVAMTSEAPKFWILRQQSLIHAKAGNKKSAISAAKQSLKYAKISGNQNYIKMNKDSLVEWGAQ